jgi:phage baseplate assembly protein V
VTFPDRDQLQSWWLPVVVNKTRTDKFYHVPDIGEQVVCFMDAHDEDGAVLGAIYSSVDETPINSADKYHVSFRDGTSVEYDRALHVLSVNFSDEAQFKYDATAHSLTISVPSGDISLSTNQHSTSINALIDTYNTHTHAGVSSGNGNSGTPNQDIR